MRITYVTVEAFKSFLERKFSDEIYDALGVDPERLETIERFLLENCADLTYTECIKKVEQEYSIYRKKEIDELISQARAVLSHYLGTPYVSDAFKKLYDKYGEQIRELFLQNKLEEFELIKDVLDLELGCRDYDIRTATELSIHFGAALQHAYDVVQFLLQVVRDYMKFKPTDDIMDLGGDLSGIGIVLPMHKDPWILLCMFTEREGLIVTHTLSTPIGVVSNWTRKFGLIA